MLSSLPHCAAQPFHLEPERSLDWISLARPFLKPLSRWVASFHPCSLEHVDDYLRPGLQTCKATRNAFSTPSLIQLEKSQPHWLVELLFAPTQGSQPASVLSLLPLNVWVILGVYVQPFGGQPHGQVVSRLIYLGRLQLMTSLQGRGWDSYTSAMLWSDSWLAVGGLDRFGRRSFGYELLEFECCSRAAWLASKMPATLKNL